MAKHKTYAEHHAGVINRHLINATVTSATIDGSGENFGMKMITEDGKELVVWILGGIKIKQGREVLE